MLTTFGALTHHLRKSRAVQCSNCRSRGLPSGQDKWRPSGKAVSGIYVWWRFAAVLQAGGCCDVGLHCRHCGVQEWSDARVHQLPAGVAGRQLRCLRVRSSLQSQPRRCSSHLQHRLCIHQVIYSPLRTKHPAFLCCDLASLRLWQPQSCRAQLDQQWMDSPVIRLLQQLH